LSDCGGPESRRWLVSRRKVDRSKAQVSVIGDGHSRNGLFGRILLGMGLW
jgi:hypothetical protein